MRFFFQTHSRHGLEVALPPDPTYHCMAGNQMICYEVRKHVVSSPRDGVADVKVTSGQSDCENHGCQSARLVALVVCQREQWMSGFSP